MAKTHKHLWPRVVAVDNLIAAAREAMRGKRTKPAAAGFFACWETEVLRLREELEEGTYRPGEYHYFTIHEPKERIVAAAPFRDRVVHHALVRVLEPLFEPRFIEDSYACRKGKGTHAGMRRAAEFARRFPWYLKCDIRRYFPNIDHGLLLGRIGKVVADRRVRGLCERILASHREGERQEWGADLLDVRLHPYGLPIGNLTSQFFANIHLDGFDHFVKQELRVKGYVRYVDDFILYGDSREDLRARGREIRCYLGALRLTLHPDKYRLGRTDDGVDFCGFVVRADGRIRVRASGVRRFARRFDRMRWEMRRGLLEPEKLSESVRAWIAHADHAQSHGLKRRVLSGCRP